ncbi:MAG: TrmH family RNA methyltransferase [Anaerovoracaceae bacterium]
MDQIVISSKDNRLYKEVRRLSKKKYRDAENRFVIEGENLVREVLASGQGADAVILREGTDCGEWLRGFTPSFFNEKLFDSVSTTETSQGIAAVVRKPLMTEEALRKAMKPGGCAVVLEKLQDPGNVGTIIRLAEGAGFDAVIYEKGTCDPFSPKTVRAAAGSLMRMQLYEAADTDEIRKIAADSGRKIAVTDVRNGEPYYEAPIAENALIVIGNEGNGCSDEIMQAADIRVNIPMSGKLESLNAAAAAALLMFERVRPGGNKKR